MLSGLEVQCERTGPREALLVVELAASLSGDDVPAVAPLKLDPGDVEPAAQGDELRVE